MSKYAPMVNDFKYGEWSPLMYGRTDLEIYRKGCETLENMLVYPYGGAFRRPGTYYVVPTKYANKKARLVPFQFSATESYVLEFGDKYIRFLKDNGQLVYSVSDCDDWDATSNWDIGDYVYHGAYIDIDCGNGRHIYFAKPSNSPALAGIESDKSVEIETNAGDNLIVSSGDNKKVLIKLADTTPAKNASDLIEAAIQALGSPFDDWTVTENPVSIVGNIAGPLTNNASGDILLLHMDGADAGTTFTDSTGRHTVTGQGDAQTKTDQKKFGTASAYFDGTGDYLTAPANNDFAFGTGDFTIDCWCRFDSGATGDFRYIFDTGAAGGNNGLSLLWHRDGFYQLNYGGVDVFKAGSAPAEDTWIHYAITREGNSLRFFIDGTLITTVNSTYDFESNTVLSIGARYDGISPFKGYIDEFRIVYGTAEWTSSFTPEVAAYTVENVQVSASTEEGASTAAWKAFDGDDDTAWTASRFTTTGWLQYEFDTAKTITDYAIVAPVDQTRAPEDFKLYGSNTGAFGGEEVELDSQVGAGFTSGERQEYNFVNVTAYLYYRVVVTANGGNSDWLSIATLELSEDGFSASSSEAAQEIVDGAGSVAETGPTANTQIYLCIQDVTAAAGNTSRFPAGEPLYWSADDSYEIETPYLEADLFDLQFAQSNDVLYIAHKGYPPMKLSRFGDTNWTIEEVDFKFGPWAEENLTAITMTPSHASGNNRTMTASAAYWEAGHVGSLFRYDTGDADCGYVKIKSITSPTVAVCDVIEELSGTAAKVEWAEGAWSIKNGYPGSVTFFEQRLFWGGSTKEPQTVWGSQSESYENHQPGSNDDDAVKYVLASQQLNAIEWLISTGKGIAAGTGGGAFTITGGGEPLSPSNVQAVRDISFGASGVTPKNIGNYAYYMDRNNRTMREYQYSFETDGYMAADMTVLAEHVTESGIVELAYQQSPYSMLWAVRADGEMCVFTRQIEEKVMAWSRVTTDGDFESVTTIPNGEEDQVWVVVNREILGNTVRYIEYFKPFKSPTEITDSFFVDSGLLYNGTPATSFSGLPNLANETVDVLADGVVVSGVAVNASGEFTLTTAASVVAVGLPFESNLLTLNLEGGSNVGTSQAMQKRIWKATVRAYNSITCKMGADGNLDDVDFDTAVLVTGDTEISFPQGWDRKGQINITQTLPLPLVILGIYPRVSVNEG